MLREHGILKISASKAELRAGHLDLRVSPKYSIATPQKMKKITQGIYLFLNEMF
jgi:hypothetical protein